MCIDEIEEVVEPEEDESTQSARLSLNEEDSPSKPQVLFFLHAMMLTCLDMRSSLLKLRQRTGIPTPPRNYNVEKHSTSHDSSNRASALGIQCCKHLVC